MKSVRLIAFMLIWSFSHSISSPLAGAQEIFEDQLLLQFARYSRQQCALMNSNPSQVVQMAALYPIIQAMRACSEGTCGLNISFHDENRKLFAEKLVSKIEESFPNKDQQLDYVSLGSGYLLQDFVILLELIKKGYKNFQIHLIDPEYVNYSSSKDRGISKAVNQFATFLRTHPETHARVFVYPNSELYLSKVRENKTPADILVSVDGLVDFEDPSFFSGTMSFDGHLLKEQALKKGGIYASLPSCSRVSPAKVLERQCIGIKNE